jgi:hypothetical protein
MNGQPWPELELLAGHGELAGVGERGKGWGEERGHDWGATEAGPPWGGASGWLRAAWLLLLLCVICAVCEVEEGKKREKKRKRKEK